jgi:hypothetical protein
MTDLVELARTFPAVVPAKAGTHNHGLWNMGPRLRGDDRSCSSRLTPAAADLKNERKKLKTSNVRED